MAVHVWSVLVPRLWGSNIGTLLKAGRWSWRLPASVAPLGWLHVCSMLFSSAPVDGFSGRQGIPSPATPISGPVDVWNILSTSGSAAPPVHVGCGGAGATCACAVLHQPAK